MTKIKRTIATLLVVLLLLSVTTVASVSAFVTYGETDDGFAYYITDDGTATFTAYRGELKDVVIPEKLNGYTVTAISGSGIMEWGEDVESITLPSTITEIHGGAFSGLNIKTINLNEGLKKIGSYAFDSCLLLESITLPESLESIGEGAFNSCRKLKSANVPEKLTILPDALFYSCDFESFNIPAHIRKMGSRIFIGNESFKEINVSEDNPYYCSVDGVLFNKEQSEILLYPCAKEASSYKVPDTVKTIGEAAFIGCSTLDELVLPEGLEHIGKNAFGGNGVESLTIPNSVTVMEENAFGNCDNLEEITLGNGLTKVENYLFYGCDNLEKVYVGSSVKSIGSAAFRDCRSLKEVSLPEGLEVISGGAFANCTLLEYLVVPNTVTEIGSEAFLDCKSLINVTLSESLVYIEQNCFRGCVELRYMVIPDSVTDIHHGAFYGCVDLYSVEFGKGVRYIADMAFSDCQSLTRITIPDNVTNISQYSIGHSTYLNCHMVTEHSVCPWVIIYANSGSAAARYAKEKGLMLGILDAEVTPFSKGDVDGDGRITIKDATLVQKHLAMLIRLEQIQEDAADMGIPGLTIGDATAIQKYLAGITEELD